MHPARIAELLAPFLEKICHSEPARTGGEEPAFLSPAQLQSISTYIDLLLRWNARINLTAVRDPEQIVTRHFGESLFAARHLFPSEVRVGSGLRPDPVERSPATQDDVSTSAAEHRGRAALQGRAKGLGEFGALAPGVRAGNRPTLADLGSGAGFPGIPIKLWAPQISLTLIESNHKKAAFLREVTRSLTLTDVDIVVARAESLVDVTFDIVTLRAVERFEAALPVAARLVCPDGRLALLVSSAQLDQACSCLPKLTWSSPVPIPLSRNRVVIVGSHRKQSGEPRL